MAYSIVCIKVQQYVLVAHIGLMRRRDLDQAWQSALAELGKNQWQRLLVDVRAVMNTLPASEMYDFVSCLREQLPANIRIALVVREDQSGDGRFIENVARNRAMDLKFFINMQPALGWLVKKENKSLQTRTG